MDGSGQRVDSHGNRVYVGDFVSLGLHVRGRWVDLRNDRLGVASVWKSSLYQNKRMPTLKWAFSLPFFG